MTLRRTTATARRVLRQLRHDPRTVGLLVAVPAVLMGILAWMLHGRDHDFDTFGPPLLGIFPLIVMFLVTSVATLRERTSGTLERLLTMPLAKADFVVGYGLAFGLTAVVQALVVSGLCFGLYGMHVEGSAWLVVVVAVMDALLGTALGLSVSALATTEFQAVQFMPAFILPQLLLCGIIVPRDQLPTVLHWVSDALPMSYAVGATQQLSTSATVTSTFVVDVAVVAAFAAGALVLGATTLRRRTP
ncbi:MAG TPA: ABC transporter permease [Acidimicrobiales bacterium]|nr:ABC transporter permease [Acidimicrobiales bacterium]